MPSRGTPHRLDGPLRRVLFIVVAVAPMLVACQSIGAKPRVADVRLPSAFEAPVPAPGQPATDPDRWWLAYNDPQLTALIEEALARSPDARDAQAKLAQAQAVRSSALNQYNPQGSLTGSGTRDHGQLLNHSTGSASKSGSAVIGTEDIYSLGFNVSWEIDLFGRRAAAARSANADLLTARFTDYATRWSLTANVADSLFQARGLAIQAREAQASLEVQRQLYQVAKAKADHGLVPTSDAAQAEANYQNTQAQADNIQAQLNAARRSLLLLVGRGVDPLASLPVPAEVGAPPPLPATAPGDLLLRRPDVRQAEWRVVSGAGRLTLNERAILPTFSLQPGLSAEQIGTSPSLQIGSWSVGVGASVPVLNIPALLAQTRQQKAVVEQSVIAYEKSVQNAYAEAETAFGYFASDSRRVALLAAAEHNAAFAYEAKRVGYARGFNDLQAALNAESTWRQTRLASAAAQVTLMQRSVQVFKAVGGGWTPIPDPRGGPKVLKGTPQ